MNAGAHHTPYGYSDHGSVRENGPQISDPQFTICVELIGQRGELFCRRHGDLLASKAIVYKHLEHRTVGVSGVEHADATPDELAAEAE